jgi:hypothetical protein
VVRTPIYASVHILLKKLYLDSRGGVGGDIFLFCYF